MNLTPLSKRESDVLLGVNDGLTNIEIGIRLGTTPGSISGACSSIRNKGYDIPRRKGCLKKKATLHPESYAEDAQGRFTARGVKKSTGERFTVTSDSQKFADAHLSAMLGGG